MAGRSPISAIQASSAITSCAEPDKSQPVSGKASGSDEKATMSTKLSPILPLITVWLQVRRSRENVLTRRANQRHYSTIAQFVKTPMAPPTNGLFGAIAGKKSFRQLKLHR